MRSNLLARTLVGAVAVAGLAAGGLAAAGTGYAAPQSAARTAVSARTAGIQAVNNLGLDTAHAANWQCWMARWGYNPGAIDGQLGTSSWKAAQRMFNDQGLGAGTVDGVVGPNTIRALQRYLSQYGYNLDVDGVAGPATRAAFWDFNAYC
ncbi:peptidoglycan-binding protein [Streptomyces sp. NPDC059224]|uniref:peptidoglycan-binding domain-containing protein n=1 Tax=Streptomyces sp. NPDC059224 TaxID=3346775 RepID=UPI003695FC7F